MSAEIFDKRVASFRKPMWHHITDPLTEAFTAVEALNRMGNYTVHQVPLVYQDTQEPSEVVAIVREPTTDDPKRYPCKGCGELVTAEEGYPTADEMDVVCEDCKFDGPPTNEAAIRI